MSTKLTININMFRSDKARAHNHHTLASSMWRLYHTHDDLSSNQCTSTMVQTIDAPLPLVWSMVRCFNNPQAYKPFVRRCTMLHGDGGVGSVRKITVQSDLPAETSIERLDFLDDEMHVMMFSIIGGDHRLVNYQSTTTMHTVEEGGGKTVVIESYVVDAPAVNTKKETCMFVDTIIGCNQNSLAKEAEQSYMAGN